ncbi:MAG TPA: cytochrome P460 family protein [Bryobacteraceae bacterium]|nr:cytochrome P460 family protein [Bryobacteraceae bacterium]
MKKARPSYASAVLLLAIATAVFGQDRALKPIEYTKEGGLALPDYSKWVFIGSGMTNQANPNPRFSNIFVDPAAYDQYMKKGVWPDRTIIFSEKRAAASMLPVTPNGGWSQTGELLGAEMEVKDAGKGGWIFYEAGPGEQIGKPAAKSMPCYSCHAEKSAVDNTFVQFYPRLVEAAKRNGTYKESTISAHATK